MSGIEESRVPLLTWKPSQPVDAKGLSDFSRDKWMLNSYNPSITGRALIHYMLVIVKQLFFHFIHHFLILKGTVILFGWQGSHVNMAIIELDS